MKKRSFFQKFMFFLNLVFSFFLLLACIVPYTSSASLAFISLAVPVLVFINISFFLFWLAQKKFLMLLPLSILVYGYFSLGTFISFNGIKAGEKQDGEISIMSFNSLGFRGKEDEWKSTAGDTIVNFIQKENPDVICFQEFDYRKIRSHYFEEYPYKYVDYEFGTDRGRVIQAIYSKYRIIEKGIIEFPNSSNSAVFADVVIKSDTVRFYNLHLESLKIRPSSIKSERSDLLFGRLRESFAKQQEQSEIVNQHMNKSPYKNIVCGDFNNNQFSSVYFNIRGAMNDSFLEKGNGYGQTINFWRFPLRIDFILVDPSFEVLSHKNYNIELSDHEPIMASIKVGTDE
ncbi:endonuclease/exonuclease/phosphatase family protein [Maribacter sp. X9]|uniref:endonuclease/exonuclease/phosphatase family protein n=1 Tax=Maribacter sp. X9 TaxID=3402159 RepID=UPI003AF38514